MKTPYIAYPPFLNFCPLPLPCHLQLPSLLLFLLSCFFGWMDDRTKFDVPFYLMILWITHVEHWYFGTRRTLMCASCNKASSLVRSDICVFLMVLWFNITHKDTQHTQGSVDWHTHINIYLHHLLHAHSSYHYYTEWIIHWHQKFTFHNDFSFQTWFTCKIIHFWGGACG